MNPLNPPIKPELHPQELLNEAARHQEVTMQMEQDLCRLIDVHQVYVDQLKSALANLRREDRPVSLNPVGQQWRQ